MLYWEIIAVCSQIRTKHINTLCGQNVELLNTTTDGTYSDHWALHWLIYYGGLSGELLFFHAFFTLFFRTRETPCPFESRQGQYIFIFSQTV
jgi:hypothetical protein